MLFVPMTNIWYVEHASKMNFTAASIEDGEIEEKGSFQKQIEVTLIKWSVNVKLLRFFGGAFLNDMPIREI